MLAVLLFILKWIGILLLSVAILFLLLLGIILFSPIRYHLQGTYDDTDMRGDFSIHWIFGLIGIKGKKEPAQNMEIQIHLFGKALGEKEKKEKNKKTKKRKKTVQKDILYSREKSAPSQQRKIPKEDVPKEDMPKEEPLKENVPREDMPKEEPQETKKEEFQKKGIRKVRLADIEEEPPRQKTPWDGIEDSAFFLGEEENHTEKEKKTEPFRKKKAATNEKSAKVKKIWQQFSKIEQKREIVKATWHFLRHVAKGILPRDLRLKGTFGTGNPVTTGYLLAAAGILKGKFGDNLQIQGDFAKRTAHDVAVQAKGKIVIGYLTLIGLRFALAKPIRPLFRIILKRRENHGKGI